MKYESNVKNIGYPQESVYARLADLNNLETVRQRLNDPDVMQRMEEEIPADKLEHMRQQLETMQFDADSVSMNVPPIGSVSIRIVEREPAKCIKFQSVNSPIAFVLWVQLLPISADTCKMRLTVDADVNPFMRMMVEKPLKDGIEKLADMLASLPY